MVTSAEHRNCFCCQSFEPRTSIFHCFRDFNPREHIHTGTKCGIWESHTHGKFVFLREICFENISFTWIYSYLFLTKMLKGGYYDHFWIHRSKWSFGYQIKAPIFLITPVKFYMQHMLLVKVISENVAKVR